MGTKKIVKTILAVVAIGFTTSCNSTEMLVDKMALLEYGKEASDQNLENLAKSYGTVINKTRKTGLKEPGVYSDYAVALVKQGKRAEANSWFNKEMEAFPSSRGYVMQLKRDLIPEYQNDNTIKTTEASVDDSEETSLPPAKRKAAEERAKGVVAGTPDDATQTSEDKAEEPVDGDEKDATPTLESEEGTTDSE